MKITRIAYHTPQIDVRGTCTALYDYAVSMRELYGIDAVVITRDYDCANHDEIAIRKYSFAFNILRYKPKDTVTNVKYIDALIKYSKSDMLYCIKYGTNDGVISKIVPTSVHCVFDLSQPHGTAFAAVSCALAQKYKRVKFVPHMIRLRPSASGENLRYQLGIPETAKVFGRYGGMDTFNLDFARMVISNIVRQRNDIYFLLCNTPLFDNHSHIIHLPKIIEDNEKNRFIQTCDAHIEAGTLGHSFGLSIGEFSVNNKPIIVYDNPSLWNRSHLEIMGDRCLKYRDAKELHEMFANFDKEYWSRQDNNCYLDYSPPKVCEQFYKVFIVPCEQVKNEDRKESP